MGFERSDNPFWLEMARRRWPPSRARLHFGDFAPPEPALVYPDDKSGSDAEYGTPEARAWADRLIASVDGSKLKRTREDIVWTAVRRDALELALPDGRKLTIGGDVADYGNEYADPWIYSDVIVTHPYGVIEILTYPKEIFPHFYWPVDAVVAGHVYIFGTLDRKRHPDRPRRPAVLRLDTQTFEITACPLPDPSVRLALYSGAERLLRGQVQGPAGHCVRSGDAHLGRAGALSVSCRR